MAKAKTIKIKQEKPPREIKRNVPWIEAIFTGITALMSLGVCAAMTYLCTWSLYVMTAMRNTVISATNNKPIGFFTRKTPTI